MTRGAHNRGSQIGIGGAVSGSNPRLIDIFAVLRPRPVAERAAPEDLSWMDRGLCTEVGGDLFFPAKGEPSAPAKSVCRGCEVRAECLEYALAHGGEPWARHGVWGGLSERERRQESRRRQSITTQSREQEAA
jgi:WhiB family transcriptional regulator, redox-sensing transcriptional regulator